MTRKSFAFSPQPIVLFRAENAEFCSQAIDAKGIGPASQAVCRGFDSLRPLQYLASFHCCGFAGCFAAFVRVLSIPHRPRDRPATPAPGDVVEELNDVVLPALETKLANAAYRGDAIIALDFEEAKFVIGAIKQAAALIEEMGKALGGMLRHAPLVPDHFSDTTFLDVQCTARSIRRARRLVSTTQKEE